MGANDDYDAITEWLGLPEARAALDRGVTDLGLRVDDLDPELDIRMDTGRMLDGTTRYRFCLRRDLGHRANRHSSTE